MFQPLDDPTGSGVASAGASRAQFCQNSRYEASVEMMRDKRAFFRSKGGGWGRGAGGDGGGGAVIMKESCIWPLFTPVRPLFTSIKPLFQS